MAFTIATIKQWYADAGGDEFFDYMLFEGILEKNGFKWLGGGAYKNVYGRRGFPYVVKYGHIFTEECKEHPCYLKPRLITRHVLVQDRVNRRRRMIAMQKLARKAPEWKDVQPGNCGWFKGKPVIIDV